MPTYPMPAAGILANPITAPVLTSASGALVNGAYLVAYAYVNANGTTEVGPIALIALDDDEQINVAAITPLPTGALSVDWFVSEAPNSNVLRFVTNNAGTSLSINALPDEDAVLVPVRNTTGGTGVKPNKYVKHSLDWGEVTIKHVYEDKGFDTNTAADSPPQRYTLTYEEKSEEAILVLDAFKDLVRYDTPFDFQEPRDRPFVRGEPGELVNGVYIEEYIDGEHSKVWRNKRVVRLIKPPS
jgi:hypothetical protein